MADYTPLNSAMNFATTQLNAEVGRKTALAEAEKDRQYNREEAQKVRDFNREERISAQEFDLDMWNRNNEYNSYANQIKRAEEAGVNRHALFSNGGTTHLSNPVRSNPASGGSPASTSSGATIGSAIMSQDSALVGAQASMLNAQASYMNSKSQARLNDYNTDWNIKTEGQRMVELSSNIDKNFAEIKRILSASGLDDVKIDEVKNNMKWLTLLNTEELKILKQNLINLYNDNIETLTNIKKSNKEIEKADQDIKESESRVGVNDANKGKIEQETKTEEANTAIKEIEKAVANELQLPIGSPEYVFFWRLWKDKTLDKFIDEAIVPTTYGKAQGMQRILNKVDDTVVKSKDKFWENDAKLGKWLDKQRANIRKTIINPIRKDFGYAFKTFVPRIYD